MNPQELESRLIDFSLMIIEIVKGIPNYGPALNLSKQLGRSGTSASLNYGEARGAESRKDFIHKMKVGLKELRETHVCLRIIREAGYYKDHTLHLDKAITENNELISIFVQSVKTAQQNQKSRNL